ncbi:MAG: hypothetical protein CSYNP_03746 [Syntrophus sp. SKADARSKE-3]|nr:hypothetical protein [Syntrophus sp. SKADARSKE-3]
MAYANNQTDGVYLRANRGWTMTSLLEALIRELDGVPMRRRSVMIDWITVKLAEKERVIFIDEADYLLKQDDMLDVMRDIYDLTGSPVILIGMEEIARKIQQNGRFARRITQWLEFQGIDLDDARITADSLCDVSLADDLVEHLHKESRANIGRMVIGLSRIESFGKTNGLSLVSLSEWGDRPLFYDQPVFRRQRGR